MMKQGLEILEQVMQGLTSRSMTMEDAAPTIANCVINTVYSGEYQNTPPPEFAAFCEALGAIYVVAVGLELTNAQTEEQQDDNDQ